MLPNLPLGLLGGKNLLESFGFVFPNGVPDVFKHPEELELDLDLELNPTFKPICHYNDDNHMYLCCKKSNNSTLNESTTMTNKLYVGTKVIQDYSKEGETNLTYTYIKNQRQQHTLNHCKLFNSTKQVPPKNETITPKTTQNSKGKRGSPANTTITTRNPSANNNSNSKTKTKNFDIESNNVDKLIGKRKLHFPNYDYIKLTHSEKLFNLFHQLLKEYDDIFAKYQYDRRDLNVAPIKLGFRPEAYTHSIKGHQPTLSTAKTKAATAIAQEHVKSGFFKPNTTSIHRVPYGLLVKRGADGTPDRFKEFYDFRKLNEYVNVRSANIPTIPQVTQWMEKQPFMLLSKFDKKNWYYQFPYILTINHLQIHNFQMVNLYIQHLDMVMQMDQQLDKIYQMK